MADVGRLLLSVLLVPLLAALPLLVRGPFYELLLRPLVARLFAPVMGAPPLPSLLRPDRETEVS